MRPDTLNGIPIKIPNVPDCSGVSSRTFPIIRRILKPFLQRKDPVGACDARRGLCPTSSSPREEGFLVDIFPQALTIHITYRSFAARVSALSH
jgi:hypothetical protein